MTLSTNTKQAMNAPETGDVFVTLLTIAHPTMANPIRVCDDIVAADVDGVRKITSRGNEYLCFPFRVPLPGVEAVNSPIQIEIDNIGLVDDPDNPGEQISVVEKLRQVSGPASVTLEIIRAADPDTVEFGPIDLIMHAAEAGAAVIEGYLGFEDTLNASYPADAFDRANFPGMP